MNKVGCRIRLSKLTSSDKMLAVITDPKSSIKWIVIAGIELWRRGLRIQAHCKRVEREELEAKQRRIVSLKKAAKQKTVRRKWSTTPKPPKKSNHLDKDFI